eukprot:6678943-Prymnesium_polylepis.1
MKGDGGDAAEPLTLGMLERLESIVKVRDQMKFNVKNGRLHLVQAIFVLMFFSFMQLIWEFVKILTYQSRFFTKNQVAEISAKSNLPMYWPSRAFDDQGQPSSAWVYNPGGPGCQTTGGCEFPRSKTNSRIKPIPSGAQRVVLIVLGGLSAEYDTVNFLRFRTRVGWSSDGLEMLMRVQIPTNAVPNWAATVMGITPDMIGLFGNRNYGTVAYDNIFRVMKDFKDKWWCDQRADCTPEYYQAAAAASPWFTGL